MKHHLMISAKLLGRLIRTCNALSDVGDLIARLWVAKLFFDSGLSKIQDWGATIVLFKYDYQVPFLDPIIAAYLGTACEFILPFLLTIGLGGRITIFSFFTYNLICVISFPFLWTPVGINGLYNHISWGILLMMLLFHGLGRLSLDHLIHKKFGHFIIKGTHTGIH